MYEQVPRFVLRNGRNYQTDEPSSEDARNLFGGDELGANVNMLSSEPHNRAIPTQAVKAVMRRSDGLFLLLQRNPATHGEQNWDLPGGLIEAGEDPETALLREVEEELGLRTQILGLLGSWQFYRAKDGQWVTVQNYLCTVVSQEIRLSLEHVTYVWAAEADEKNYPVKDTSFWQALS